MVVIKKKVKESLEGLRVQGNLIEELDKIVEDLVKKAVERAKENGRKTVRAIDVSADKIDDVLVVKARVKELVGDDVLVSSDFVLGLSDKVADILTDAVTRAKENGRNTVMTKDL